MDSSSTSARTDQTLMQLRAFIDAGDYAPGDRLPAERQLISSLGVTRNALRRSLDELEREGAIWRHVGKGTFITAQETTHSNPNLAELSNQVTPVQMMRTRLTLEPAIAREAAANASGDALKKILTAKNNSVSATSWDTYEAHDDNFHRAVAEATGNVLLVSLFDHLNQVRRAVAWKQVVRKTDRPPANHPSFSEHDELFLAIQERDPAAAHEAMRAHLTSVFRRLFGDV